MTTLAALEAPAAAVLLAAPFRLWDKSALELHDAYWQSLGVAVVRPGTASAPPPDAGMYLLAGSVATALLDFRKLLDVMGWMSPHLCLLRPVVTSSPDPRDTLPAHAAFTPDHQLALQWHASRGDCRAWQNLKRSSRKTCIARPRGRLANTRGHDADELLITRLARLWTDPTAALPNVKRIAKRIFAIDGADTHARPAAPLPGPLWLGRGRRIDEAAFAGPSCVLADAS